MPGRVKNTPCSRQGGQRVFYVCYKGQFRLADNHFADFVALFLDVEAVGGVLYTYTLEVVVNCGSSLVVVNNDVVNTGTG